MAIGIPTVSMAATGARPPGGMAYVRPGLGQDVHLSKRKADTALKMDVWAEERIIRVRRSHSDHPPESVGMDPHSLAQSRPNVTNDQAATSP
jgi:hypothetical protein